VNSSGARADRQRFRALAASDIGHVPQAFARNGDRRATGACAFLSGQYLNADLRIVASIHGQRFDLVKHQND
jgi:hypothetical protein